MNQPTDYPSLFAAWQHEEQEPFSGWDFSHLAGRMFEEDPPWSYMDRVGELMRGADNVLDLGTGGGERLLALRHYWPPHVAATEGYPPNFALASRRLSLYGVDVKQAESDESTILPFADSAFDLIVCRHSSFNAAELARVLAPSGVFYTQQVHGLSGADLQARFGATPQWPYATPDYFGRKLEEAGLTITGRQEWQGILRFADVGAIIYYLRAVPWLVPDFSIATHSHALLALQEQLDIGRALTFTTRLYTLEARHR